MKARIPGDMGGGNRLKQLQKMQEDMMALQEELDAREYTVAAGGNMVRLTMNGKKEVLNLELEPDVVDPDDTETLADLITAAVNEAIRRVEEANREEMGRMTAGFGLPAGLM